MSKILHAGELERALDLFHQEMDKGKALTELPIKQIDWNSREGKRFLKARCRKGNGDEIINQLKVLRLKDESAIEILCVAIEHGAPVQNMPPELTFLGGEEKCKTLWDTIVKNRKGKEYLELLRSCRTGSHEKKLHAYDYVVIEYKYKGLGILPSSKVVYGKFEEEEKEEQQRQAQRAEQQLMEQQNLPKEQTHVMKRRRIQFSKTKMDFFTRELKEKGVSAIKQLWRSDALGNYADADDVKDFPQFIQELTRIINNAIEKGFEETHRCVRAFPLLYGGEVRYDAPQVIKKAFKKYPLLLKAIEREFLDFDPREKQDYFHFVKIAVTNPEFDWETINLDRLPEDGLVLYNEHDERVVLSVREQLGEIARSLCWAEYSKGMSELSPYVHNSVRATLDNLKDIQKKEQGASSTDRKKGEARKGSWVSRFLKKSGHQ